jgi:hypothetical protein
MYKCYKCGTPLTTKNSWKSYIKKNFHICKKCKRKYENLRIELGTKKLRQDAFKKFGSHSCKCCTNKLTLKNTSMYNILRNVCWCKYCTKNFKKRHDLKNEVFAAYGNKCMCCGETKKEFLTIDHVDGRKNSKYTGFGEMLYTKLRQDNFPKTKIRLLCIKCNWAIGIHGYCPHQKESK